MSSRYKYLYRNRSSCAFYGKLFLDRTEENNFSGLNIVMWCAIWIFQLSVHTTFTRTLFGHKKTSFPVGIWYILSYHIWPSLFCSALHFSTQIPLAFLQLNLFRISIFRMRSYFCTNVSTNGSISSRFKKFVSHSPIKSLRWRPWAMRNQSIWKVIIKNLC